MVRPMYRSRSLRRIWRRTPGGRTVIHYERRRRGVMRCGRCGAPLGGVPISEDERRWLPKTKKRPERMFGGVLCPRCLKEVLKEAVRKGLSL